MTAFLKDLEELSKEMKESKDPSNALPMEATDLLTKQVLAMKAQLAGLEDNEESKRLLTHSFPVDSSVLQQKALNQQLFHQVSLSTCVCPIAACVFACVFARVHKV